MSDRVGTAEIRHAAITQMLAELGRLDVADAAEQLGVAQETVRRDLRALEAAGLLHRVHGGAIAVDSGAATRVPIPTLTSPDPSDAKLAARLWQKLLPRSGTILIGSGPLTLAVTHAIVSDPPASGGLTVVTNSLDAAVHLARVPKLSVYNVGGTVSPHTRAQEGDWALEELGRLRVDVAVLSPAGLSVEHGLSESTPAAAAIAQAAVACSDRRIAVCPASVVGRNAFVHFASIDEVEQIVISGRLDPSALRELRDQVNVLGDGLIDSPEDRAPIRSASTHHRPAVLP
jgi:DeoR family transcriptional regulator, fructose operon transcriptional repressor